MLQEDSWYSVPPPPPPKPPRRFLPTALFIATCLSTLLVAGPAYSLAIMSILLAHELGHYLQARRYGVPASLPYFIPMPLTPVGTMGAVIAMQARTAGPKALYDIAITGPIAGLIPALTASVLGLRRSEILPAEGEGGLMLGEPLIFKLLARLLVGEVPEGQVLMLDALAFAGWVGILITALNLLPIGQLDGGHILYTLMPKRAHLVSRLFLLGAIVIIVVGRYWGWALFVLILLLMGLRHPPAAEDGSRLGPGRRALGFAMLLFVFLGLTPIPFDLAPSEPEKIETPPAEAVPVEPPPGEKLAHLTLPRFSTST